MTDPTKAADWDDDMIDGVNALYHSLCPEARHKVDVTAQMLFLQLKMVGLIWEWPETLPQLDQTHMAKLLHISMVLNSEGLT